MNQESLYEQLDESREQLLVLLSELSDEALLQPNSMAGGSIADVLLLLAVWEAECVTGLAKIKQGKKPRPLAKSVG